MIILISAISNGIRSTNCIKLLSKCQGEGVQSSRWNIDFQSVLAVVRALDKSIELITFYKHRFLFYTILQDRYSYTNIRTADPPKSTQYAG